MTGCLKQNKRQQLTLFVPEIFSTEIEQCRKKYNPEQFQLIKAHITLCREDEIEPIEMVKANLDSLIFNSFVLKLGNPILFSGNKGVLIPIVGNDEEFKNLRKRVLNNITESPKDQKPHITIMHPRNSICTEFIFKEINTLKFPDKIRFSKISLIEQALGEPWNILKEYELIN